MKKPLLAAMVLAGLVTLQFCGCTSSKTGGGDAATSEGAGGAAASAGRTLRIDGSSTVYPVSALMMEKYKETHADARIAVALSGTGGGMKKFIAGEIDICDASRAIKPTEIEACQDMGAEYVELAVAYDGLAVVVSKENDWCDSLTVEQLKHLWRPDNPAQKWSDLDPSWPDEKVHLYGPGVDSGTFDYFTEEIVGTSRASRSDYGPSEDDNVLVTGVSSNKYALGYFGFFYFEENKEKLKLLGVDAGDGPIKPTMETVSQNTYKPLSRPLFIYVRKTALSAPMVKDFVKFYLEQAADASKQVGYVPVKDEIQEENWRRFEEATKS